MKYCSDCEFSFRECGKWLCGKYTHPLASWQRIDELVTGEKPRTLPAECSTARQSQSLCGLDAVGFSPKKEDAILKPKPDLISNEQVIWNHIAKSGAKALTVEWVSWMLQLLVQARQSGANLNPEWVEAEIRSLQDYEPPMIYK